MTLIGVPALAPTLFFLYTIIATTSSFSMDTKLPQRILRISEPVWRKAASKHFDDIYRLLQPGLVIKSENVINNGMKQRQFPKRIEKYEKERQLAALDPYHPIYNFLIEYYWLKGLKGTKRLTRWCPNPILFTHDASTIPNNEKSCQNPHKFEELRIISTKQMLEKIVDLSSSLSTGTDSSSSSCFSSSSSTLKEGDSQISSNIDGILLEGATESDISDGILHLRGANMIESSPPPSSSTTLARTCSTGGILYSNPFNFFSNSGERGIKDTNEIVKTASQFTWYKSILQNTLKAEPVLHCYGLHEWAMQYRPSGAEEPPSAKYQKHLPLRVSRATINETVERRGVSCTHVDAIRFFAPAATPLNKYGSSNNNDLNTSERSSKLKRTDQLHLEQPGCVHAHMDLLKIALKLQPYIDSSLVVRALDIALQARKIDIEASPYDATSYDDSIGIIPIETEAGRTEYKKQQKELMKRADPIRHELYRSYDIFLNLAFDDDTISRSSVSL